MKVKELRTVTDYIEQMMQTAGVEKYKPIYDNGICIAVDKDHYPEFTPEKQMEVIKLIVNQHENIVINSTLVDHKSGFLITEDSSFLYTFGENTNFTQALAQFTTELMNIGKMDKEKVKEILQ